MTVRTLPLATAVLPLPLHGDAALKDFMHALTDAARAVERVRKLLDQACVKARADVQQLSAEELADDATLDAWHAARIEPLANGGVFLDEWGDRLAAYTTAVDAIAAIAPSWQPAARACAQIYRDRSAMSDAMAHLVNQVFRDEAKRRARAGRS